MAKSTKSQSPQKSTKIKDHRKFRAWDRQRVKEYELDSSPAKLRQHRVNWREWSKEWAKPSRKVQKRQKAKKPKRPVTAATILRYNEYEIECLHCGRAGDDPECGISCYRDFRKTVLTGESLTELRDVGALGYGVFTKPWSRIEKGQYLDEYFGDLRPLNAEDTGSRYNFFIPGKYIIDGERAGNSHCRPNVTAEPSFVGKRRCVLFRAVKDIGPGEEVVFNYGKGYFKHAGIVCECSACVPVEGVGRAKRVRKGRSKAIP